MSESFFVYILANRPRGVLYVGVTNNLARRVSEHRSGIVPGFTRAYGVKYLVHAEPYQSIDDARTREHSLKRCRAWKFELIEQTNPGWKDLSDML